MLESLWKTLEIYSELSKENVIELYYKCISWEDIDTLNSANYTIHTILKYEIDENKIAVNKILEFIDEFYLDENIKIGRTLDKIYELSSNNYKIFLPLFKEAFEKEVKNKILDLYKYKKSESFSLLSTNWNNLESQKKDFLIDWKKWYIELDNTLNQIINSLIEINKNWWNWMLFTYMSDWEFEKMLNTINKFKRNV